MVIVDTSIWSAVLRKRGENVHTPVIQGLIAAHKVQLLGPIRQEILSGIREADRFQMLRQRLSTFPDRVLVSADYEQAAEFFNLCRSRGIQGSNTDFLICAAAARRQFEIYTADADFSQFAAHIPLQLFNAQP